MRKATILRFTVSLAAALGAATGAWAIPNATLPPEQTQGAVTYMSGGIGRSQQLAMKRAASRYALELEFLHTGKAYDGSLAYVPVTIKDRTGKVVFDAASDGPVMLLKLPAGRYTIIARNADKTDTARVSIEHGKHQTLAFDWKG
jgi:hypothetical protein